MKRLHHHLLAATLLAGFGLSAFAQAQAPAPNGVPASAGQHFAQRGGERHAMNPERMQERHARMEKRMQERLEFFKFKLKLTPAQEGAWNAWAAAIKPTARPRMHRMDRAEFKHLSTPERIDRMRARRDARQAEMDKRMDATKVFYATLNAEQKQVFDEAAMRLLRGGHGKHGHRGHHYRG